MTSGRSFPLDVKSSHARRYLLPSERLVAEVRWHPVWLARRALILVAVVVPAGWLAAVLPADNILLDVAGLATLLAFGWFAWQVGEWWNERLVMTDRRMMLASGLLTRKIAVMPLRKVTDLTYERPLMGRLFARYGWGTFVLESAGQDQALHRVPFLPEPDELYRRLSQEIFGDRGLYGSANAGEDEGSGGSRGPARPAPTRPAQPAGVPADAQDPTVIIKLREDD